MYQTIEYEVTGRIARITLNRAERGNGIDLRMPREIAHCVEEADLDSRVHVVALSGRGKGFCGGYDLVDGAELLVPREEEASSARPEQPQSPLDLQVIGRNHDPRRVWDPMLDYQMMSRNVRGFMSLLLANKPVVCKIHGFCVGGGSDLALCCDLMVIAEDAKIGYPPARVWGTPTTALWVQRVGIERAKRLLFTGDCLSGQQAKEWGLAIDCFPSSQLDGQFEALLERIARLPQNQLIMHKLLLNQSLFGTGLAGQQLLGTLCDGIARHTAEGYAFQQRVAEVGFKQAVRERDAAFEAVQREKEPAPKGSEAP